MKASFFLYLSFVFFNIIAFLLFHILHFRLIGSDQVLVAVTMDAILAPFFTTVFLGHLGKSSPSKKKEDIP